MTHSRLVAIASSPGSPNDVIEIVTEDVAPVNKGHVEVEVAAAAANHSENLALAGGAYATGLTFPVPLGYEGAGTVIAAGGGDTPVGTRVAFMSPGRGSCATHVTVPQAMTVPIPDSMTFDVAARIVSAGITAQLLTRVRDLDGLRIAIWGAAGPVGRMLTSFATTAGAHVVGIASGKRVEDVTAAGAAATVDRRQGAVAQAIRDATHGHGVDVVFDPVGATTYRASLDMLALRGLYVSFGQLCGELPTVDLMDLMEKGIQVTKAGGGRAFMNDSNELSELMRQTVSMAANSPASVADIAGRFALRDTANAYRCLADGAIGKVVIVCESEPTIVVK